MGDMLEIESPLIEPVYSQTEPSQSIDLGAVAVEFKYGGKTYKEKACVSMRFTPNDRLLLVVPADDGCRMMKEALKALADGLDDWDGKLKLPNRNVTLDAFCTGRGGAHGAFTFLPSTSVVTVTPRSDGLTEAVFHLFNFPDFIGREDYSITIREAGRGKSTRCGRVILNAGGWVVTIAATDNTHDQCKALRRGGGFIVTHMGKIEREGHSSFSSEQLEDVLSCVHCFLSFALGRWAGVALPIGIDRAGEKVFEQWGMPLAAAGPWNGSCSWFDAHHSQFLSEVFPGFMDLWKSETWNPAIRAALYWYLGANERGTGIGVDTGLILAQTALERLAWTYCVQHRKMISSEAFGPRGLSAADKLRLLASALDIPLALPDCGGMPALHAKRGKKWQDAMDAITTIRNSIVHPHAKKQLPKGSYYEAWKLSLWYLDMILLRLCRHQGKYANRLVQRRTGQVEAVPWADSRAVDERDKPGRVRSADQSRTGC